MRNAQYVRGSAHDHVALRNCKKAAGGNQGKAQLAKTLLTRCLLLSRHIV
jgi:hypothetical protein